MKAWALVVNGVGVVLMGLLLAALRWAAIERGRIHGEWARQQNALRQKIVRSIDWCMAVATAAGCA